MSQEKAEAHVLRGVDYSETSRIVTFLTPDRGCLTCIAKGVRRKNSPLAPVLSTMNRVELVYYWKEGRSIQTLADATLLNGYRDIRRDLEKGAYAAFPLEVVLRVAHENEPSREFYGALRAGLEQLEVWTGDPRAHCSWQVAKLLVAAGFAPALDRCVQCDREISDNPGFDLDGGAVCNGCGTGIRLAAPVLADLRAIFSATGQCPTLAAPPETFGIVRRYTARQTESDYRSLRVLDDMFPGNP